MSAQNILRKRKGKYAGKRESGEVEKGRSGGEIAVRKFAAVRRG